MGNNLSAVKGECYYNWFLLNVWFYLENDIETSLKNTKI